MCKPGWTPILIRAGIALLISLDSLSAAKDRKSLVKGKRKPGPKTTLGNNNLGGGSAEDFARAILKSTVGRDRGEYLSTSNNAERIAWSPPICSSTPQDIDDIPPPQFLLISCAKCGSTAFYHHGICKHPRISCRAKIKVPVLVCRPRNNCNSNSSFS